MLNDEQNKNIEAKRRPLTAQFREPLPPEKLPKAEQRMPSSLRETVLISEHIGGSGSVQILQGLLEFTDPTTQEVVQHPVIIKKFIPQGAGKERIARESQVINEILLAAGLSAQLYGQAGTTDAETINRTFASATKYWNHWGLQY